MKRNLLVIFMYCFVFNGCDNSPKYSDKEIHTKNINTKHVEHIYSKDSIRIVGLSSKKEQCKVDSIGNFYVPKNLKDAHLTLDKMLDNSSKVLLAKGVESHLGLGMQLRNNWGLWSGSRLKCYFEYKGISHPDHMSGIIIHTYSMRLNNQRINEDSIIILAIKSIEDWEY